jgi:hypothetical protein
MTIGLENIDREILRVMFFNFEGGPVGLSTLAASVSEDISTITDVHEPYLMKCGFIKRTSRGRVLNRERYKICRKDMALESMSNTNEDAVKRGKLLTLSLLIAFSIFVQTIIKINEGDLLRTILTAVIYFFVSFCWFNMGI